MTTAWTKTLPSVSGSAGAELDYAVATHIGRVAADEAGAQLLADTLDACHCHFVLWVEGAEDVCGMVDISAAITTLKEDALDGNTRLQPKRVHRFFRYLKP